MKTDFKVVYLIKTDEFLIREKIRQQSFLRQY